MLDVGGGGGFFANLLSRRGADVCLVDYSEAAVAFARSRFPELRVVQMSVYELDALVERYDVVICFDVIEHLERPRDMLEAIKDVLVPDGRFYIATDNESSPFNTIRLLGRLERLGRHLSTEGRDYNMINRVESYRRSVLGIDYHASHVTSYGLGELWNEVESCGWLVIRYRTYHLYDDPLKKFLSWLLGPKNGTHMVFECVLR